MKEGLENLRYCLELEHWDIQIRSAIYWGEDKEEEYNNHFDRQRIFDTAADDLDLASPVTTAPRQNMPDS